MRESAKRWDGYMSHAVCNAVAAALADKARVGRAGGIVARRLAAGEGWRAMDYVCTCGPRDRVFEERHAFTSVTLVLSGTFACRSRHGESLLSAGSLFLGSVGQSYECSHQHSEGDRCLSFQFEPATFAELAHDAGAAAAFDRNDLPPLRAFAPLAARAEAAMRQPAALEEVAVALAGAALRAAGGGRRQAPKVKARHHGRIANVLRLLETHLAEPHSLVKLARFACLSPYHFLRTFRDVTGVTPHQWLLRTRLRAAAQRLSASDERVTDIAFDVGFEDLSNFVRSFRAEFGVSPRAYRAAA